MNALFFSLKQINDRRLNHGNRKKFFSAVAIVPIVVMALYSMSFSAPAVKPIVLKTGVHLGGEPACGTKA